MSDPKCPNCEELELALLLVSREVARLHDLRDGGQVKAKPEVVVTERNDGNVVYGPWVDRPRRA